MKKTTLCYIRKNGKWLMLYRNKKPQDPNAGKWIGIGGHIEPGETPEECNLREVREETGLQLKSAHFHGVIHFRSDEWEDEDMYLFSSDDFEPAGTLSPDDFEPAGAVSPDDFTDAEVPGEGFLAGCDEGELAWIPDEKIFSLPMWEGDKLFLSQIAEGRADITMTLRYQGEKLIMEQRFYSSA